MCDRILIFAARRKTILRRAAGTSSFDEYVSDPAKPVPYIAGHAPA